MMIRQAVSQTPRETRRGPGGVGAAHPDPYKRLAFGVAAMISLTLPATVGVILVFQPASAARTMTASVGSSVVSLSFGQSTYASACAVCHGGNAEGVNRYRGEEVLRDASHCA